MERHEHRDRRDRGARSAEPAQRRGAAGTAAKAAPSPTAPKAASDLSKLFTPEKTVLHPGLYRFEYTGGVLTGVSPVVFFTGNGVVRPMAEKPAN